MIVDREAELAWAARKMARTESYHQTFRVDKRLVGVCISVAFLVSAVVMVLLVSGHLTTLPKDLASLFQMKNIIPLAASGAGIALLVGGAFYVIYHAIHRKHSLLGDKPLGLFDSDKLEEVCITYLIDDGGEKLIGFFGAYLDTSTLDENGDGIAYVYRIKPCFPHYFVSVEVCLGTPIYMIGSIAFNVIRFFIIPFFILFGLVTQKPTDVPTKKDYAWIDIPMEMGKSAKCAIKAPFYAAAYLIAALYSLIMPMHGRRLAFAIENDWNEGVSLAEGIWTFEPQPLFRGSEWQEDAEVVRQNIGMSLAGCWHPTIVATFEDGVAMYMYSIEQAVELKKGNELPEGRVYENLYRRKDLTN